MRRTVIWVVGVGMLVALGVGGTAYKRKLDRDHIARDVRDIQAALATPSVVDRSPPKPVTCNAGIDEVRVHVEGDGDAAYVTLGVEADVKDAPIELVQLPFSRTVCSTDPVYVAVRPHGDPGVVRCMVDRDEILPLDEPHIRESDGSADAVIGCVG